MNAYKRKKKKKKSHRRGEERERKRERSAGKTRRRYVIPPGLDMNVPPVKKQKTSEKQE